MARGRKQAPWTPSRKTADHWFTRPLTAYDWDDLVAVFGGGAGRCDPGHRWCMWWRLPRPGIGKLQGHDTKALFRALVAEVSPPGLVGYVGDEPMG